MLNLFQHPIIQRRFSFQYLFPNGTLKQVQGDKDEFSKNQFAPFLYTFLYWINSYNQGVRVSLKAILSKSVVFVLFLSIFVTCNLTMIHAQVFISEVYPAPASGESEWVELCNPSEQAVDLTAHYLMDQLSTPSVLLTFASQSINPLSALVINLAGSKLNNTGDSVSLYNPSNQVLDQVTFVNSSSGQSFAKQASDQSLSINSLSPGLCLPQHFPPSPTPTPTNTPPPLPTPTSTPLPTTTTTPLPSPTSTPKPSDTPTPTPTQTATVNPTSTFPADQFTSLIEVSEIMACPESGSSEWLELYNFSNSTIDLTGWYVLDAVNNQMDLSIVIASKNFGVVEFSRAIINNSGDTISILSPDGVVRWQTTLGACTTGQSFSLIGGQFVLGPPTPNATNAAVGNSSSSITLTNSSSTTSTTTNSATSLTPPPTPVLIDSSLVSTSNDLWPAELSQVLGDVDDLTWPKLLKSQSTTSSAVINQQSTEGNLNTHSQTRLAPSALFGSSLGGVIMLSSGLLLAYVTWKNQLATAF